MRFTTDLFNNLRRMCTVSGTNAGRVWKVVNAMKSMDPNNHVRYYMVKHINTGKRMVVNSDRMGNLY